MGSLFAGLPRFKMGIIVAPWDAVVLLPERVLRAVGEGMDDGLVEIAPDQLRQPFVVVLNPSLANSRMLTVPNRRCTLMRVVPRLAGKSRVSA